MERQEFEVLLARVERLERRVRVVAAGWVLSVAVFVLLGVAVQQAVSQPEVLRVRRIEVVDAAGRARILLGVTPDGVARFSLIDAAGQTGIRLSVHLNGWSALSLLDAAGRLRITLNVLDGLATLSLIDAAGQTGIGLTVGPDGSRRFTLMDAAGRALFQAP